MAMDRMSFRFARRLRCSGRATRGDASTDVAQVLDSTRGPAGLREGASGLSKGLSTVRFPVGRPGIGRSISRTGAAHPAGVALARSMHERSRATGGGRRKLPKESHMSTQTIDRFDYELRYQPLSGAGRGLAFPCDAAGQVDMNALCRAAFNNYLYARAFVGREFLRPLVRARGDGSANDHRPPRAGVQRRGGAQVWDGPGSTSLTSACKV
jgi:hypothetical protein